MNQNRIANQILQQKIFTLNSTLNYLFNTANMKKLFTYLLISSMVVLSSCTNYDDQFDDLNSQLSTLKSQIDGFSSLSSGLTALQGTVSSLQAAVAALPKTATPATDISGLEAALTALAAEVVAIKTALDGAATSAEVAALQANLTAAQSDLASLLAQNNVYAPVGAVLNVKSQSQLDFATALGDKVTIINGAIDIDQTVSMNATQLATLMGKFMSVTGDVTYTATLTSTTPGEFTKLNGAANVTVSVAAATAINMPVLKQTGNLSITAANATSVSLPELTKATSLGTLSFLKATTFSAPVLAAHNNSLSISIADSGSIDLSSLTYSVKEDGTAATSTAYVLTVKAGTLTAPVFKIGKIVTTKVASVSLPVWEGTSTSTFTDASSVVLPKIKAVGVDLSMVLQTMFPDAVSVHIVGNSSTSTAGATTEVSVTSVASPKLETLILGGTFSGVGLKDDSDLVTLNVDITAEDFLLDNSDVVTAAIDMTAAAASTTGLTSVIIQNNTKLTSITVNEVDDLNTLVISNNSDLVSVSFPELNSATGTGAIATIKDNDFKGTVTYTSAAGAAVEAGSLASTSGLVELGDFLDSVITKRTASVSMKVILDEATEVSALGASTSTTDYALVDLQTAVSTTVGAIGAKKQAKAWTLATDGAGTANIQIGSDWVFVDASGARQDITPSANMALAAAELASSTAVTRAAALGLDLSASVGATVGSITVSFTATNDSATVESNIANAATASATAMTANQYATLTIGTNTVTATNTDTVGGIATSLVNAYNAKYTTASSLYVVTDTASKIVISVAAGSGNRAHNQPVSISTTTASAVAGVPNAILGYVIGATKATTDNKMVGTGIVIRLQNKLDGDTFPTVLLSSTNASLVLTSTLAYATATTADTYAANQWPGQARGIVEPYFVGTGGTTTVTGTTSTVDRTSFL